MPINQQLNKPMSGNPPQMPVQNVIINNPGVNMATGNNQQMMNTMQPGPGMIVNKPAVQQQQQPNQQAGAMNPQISNQQLKMQLQQQIRPQIPPGQPAQYQTKLVTLLLLSAISLLYLNLSSCALIQAIQMYQMSTRTS